jgi:hypothetical protein
VLVIVRVHAARLGKTAALRRNYTPARGAGAITRRE